MEKVNKTRNATAESAQSTPTHPWLTELHPRKLFMHACAERERERLADRFTTHLAGNGWEADYRHPIHAAQTRTKRDTTAHDQHDDDDDDN